MKKLILNTVILFAVLVTIFFTYSVVKAVEYNRETCNLVRGKQQAMKISNENQATLLIIGLLFAFYIVANIALYSIDYLTSKF